MSIPSLYWKPEIKHASVVVTISEYTLLKMYPQLFKYLVRRHLALFMTKNRFCDYRLVKLNSQPMLASFYNHIFMQLFY